VIGVVTGMRAEAACLPSRSGLSIAVSGGNPARARVGTERLIAEGVTGLVSFGLAGGLDPSLRPGQLVLAEAVLLPEGDHVPTEPAWLRHLTAIAGEVGLAAERGLVTGSDHLLVTTQAKWDLFEATGASAVDMESHVVAALARAAALPLAVVRVVADPWNRRIPQAARAALDPEGRVRVRAVLGDLLRRPTDLPLAIRLAYDSQAAFATLRRLGRGLTPGSIGDPPPPSVGPLARA
jgi:adenosylhomocysteine nucleosidase